MATEQQQDTSVDVAAAAAEENKLIAERRAKLAARREQGVAFPNTFLSVKIPETGHDFNVNSIGLRRLFHVQKGFIGFFPQIDALPEQINIGLAHQFFSAIGRRVG